MKCLRILDGDISFTTGRRAEFVYGKDKLLQDLKLWLMEPFGIGPTTPSFGTSLNEMIGEDRADALVAKVRAEIQRVLSLYQAFQFERLRLAKKNGTLAYWSRQEILQEITDVRVNATLDRVEVVVSLTTMSQAGQNNAVSLPLAITTSGLQVS